MTFLRGSSGGSNTSKLTISSGSAGRSCDSSVKSGSMETIKDSSAKEEVEKEENGVLALLSIKEASGREQSSHGETGQHGGEGRRRVA